MSTTLPSSLPPTTLHPTRLSYLLDMRRRFCLPDMLIDNHSAQLNFDYFKPKALPSSAWTEEDDATLLKALLALPFGKWTTMRKDYLPNRDKNELRLRCMQWLGIQNLTQYEGWRIKSKDEIDKEKEKNLTHAKENNVQLVYGLVPDPKFGKLVAPEDEEDDIMDASTPITTTTNKSKRMRKAD